MFSSNIETRASDRTFHLWNKKSIKNVGNCDSVPVKPAPTAGPVFGESSHRLQARTRTCPPGEAFVAVDSQSGALYI